MYKKQVPYKDLNGKPRNEVVHFHLFEHEVFKLMLEFKTILDWRDSLQGPQRDLDTVEVVEFYNALEEILLSAYGVPSEDGRSFNHDGRYEFEKTALFNAIMITFVTDPAEANKIVDELMPSGLEEIIRKADVNLEKVGTATDNTDLQAEVNRLRAQLANGNVETKAS